MAKYQNQETKLRGPACHQAGRRYSVGGFKKTRNHPHHATRNPPKKTVLTREKKAPTQKKERKKANSHGPAGAIKQENCRSVSL